jgi:hypothetical protein
MMIKGLKSVYHVDTFRPSVILVSGYLTHKKICEVAICEYVRDRKLLCHIQGEVVCLQY